MSHARHVHPSRWGVVMTEPARRKPLGLSPRGEVGLRWLEPEVLPLAYWPIVSYNYDMNTPPDYQTIRIWTRTLRSLRLLSALTGERMVQVLLTSTSFAKPSSHIGSKTPG